MYFLHYTHTVYSNLCHVWTFRDPEIHSHDYHDFWRGPTHGFAIRTSRGANQGCQPATPPSSPPKPNGDIAHNTAETEGVRKNDTRRNLKMLKNRCFLVPITLP